VNEDQTDRIIRNLKEEIEKLKEQLQTGVSGMHTVYVFNMIVVDMLYCSLFALCIFTILSTMSVIYCMYMYRLSRSCFAKEVEGDGRGSKECLG
jgi:hypothetical protein